MIVISRWKWLIPVAVLALAVCWPGLAPAATINYFGGGFYAEGRAYVENLDLETNDSGIQWDSGPNSAATSPTADVYAVSAQSINNAYHDSDDDNHRRVVVQVEAISSSYFSGLMEAYGIARTVTNGILFRITPSGVESWGDPVMLSWDWNAEANALSGATASLTGGYYADMGIFLEDAPIWTKTGEVLVTGEDFSDDASGEHLAHIGDIIGVHLGAEASFSDGMETRTYSNQEINLYVDTLSVPIPGAVWLLGSGLVGLAGLRRQLKR